MQCVKCDKETKNPKFCSRSCSASFNNKKYPKRKVEGSCKICKTSITSTRVCCSNCSRNRDITLKEAVYTYLHKASAYTLVRGRARSVAKKQGWTSCKACGYDTHIEIAHIKAIKDFSEDTKLSVINAVSNLMPLCRNCHWEFDHGLVTL